MYKQEIKVEWPNKWKDRVPTGALNLPNEVHSCNSGKYLITLKTKETSWKPITAQVIYC